ncbi:MAG: cation-translocating P-type ATPase [Burkholderiaceae bacterium]|jgi:Cu2+-exporting ATPase|nr:cation-translocating P-type ATPase [Burkholderiaceae bacterium]
MPAPSALSTIAAAGPPPPDALAPDEGLRLLDDPDEWREFSRPVERGQDAARTESQSWESSVVFEGMYCAACAGTIEDALCAVPGVQSAQVSAASRRGRVVWDAALTQPSRWMSAVRAAGYRPLPAHDPQASERRLAETRTMLWRLAVAGVCMMQVMMCAAPTYLPHSDEIAPDLLSLLRWAGWMLAIPVMVFSCQPFFANALRDLRQRRVSMDLPVALGMGITFVVSTLGTFDPKGLFGHEVYFDSLTMFVFFLLAGRWLELRLRDRTAGALESLMHRLPESVERQCADGSFERVAARRLRVGDVVRVRPGEAFAADGVLLRGDTTADEALLTGESTPLPRGVGDTVIAGSHNLGGVVEQRVDRLGADTRYAQIVALMAEASTAKPRLARLADRVARPFLLAMLLAAGLSVAWWWPSDPGHAVMIGVAVLVVTCPCALSLATPVAMLAAAGSMARAGVLVRHLQALETLAGVDTVVFDKTGTLTRDGFVLVQARARAGVSRQQALALAAALAGGSLHPVSRALAAAAQEEAPLLAGGWRVEAQQEVAGQGVRASVHAPSIGVQGAVSLGSAAFCGLSEIAAGDEEASEGLQAHLSDAQGWLASFTLREDLRDDAAAAVRALAGLGVQVRLLSGDAPQAAERLAAQAGIAQARGGCTPADKLAQLRAWQQAGHSVAMIGDGLNDGPVLAGADVSVAFGRSVPLARAQSDFVVMSDYLTPVVAFFVKARHTMAVVRQNLMWAVGYNAVAVPLAVAGWMPAWAAGLGMAASSLLVVLNALRLARP